MADICILCDRRFQSQEALTQHTNSQAHANRQLANQLERDRSIVSQPPGLNPRSLPTQEQANRQKILVSRRYPLGSQCVCSPCSRSFKNQTALDQHLQSSEVHKRVISSPSKTQSRAPVKNSGPSNLPTRNLQLNSTPSGSSVSNVQNYVLGENLTNNSSPWSVIPAAEYQALSELLSQKCHSAEDLRKNQYLLQPYSASDISGKRKCEKCGRLEKDSHGDSCYFHPGKPTAAIRNSQRHYTCCQTANKGCTSVPTHKYGEVPHARRYRAFASSPAYLPYRQTFRAITLDCEMVEVRGKSEVVYVCAVDYFTGAVLLNSLVKPDEKVRDWRTEIHGITKSAVDLAASQGRALAGWREAREELWKLIDQGTILVGHALQHDLDVLRMVHTRVVDSAILTSNAVGMSKRQWGLQKLCKELLGFEIRANKGGVHDCLEDVLATREIVLLCNRDPQVLETWAKAKRLDLAREEEQRKAARQRKNANKKRAERQKTNSGSSCRPENLYNDEDSEEVLRWSDIAEDCGYPHPDTGYDPWSD